MSELHYPNRAHEGTHPDRLSLRARLFGVDAAPPTKCRVLDLGCAGGANVIAMALDLPDSELVGVDLSSHMIDTGRALAEAVGVKNVKLAVKNVMDLSRADGEFDYIVAHGLYSWVGPDVKKKILSLVGEMLAPNGVAYLSYNTLPGFYTRAKARDLMRFHAEAISDPPKKVEQGLAALGWLCEGIGQKTTYGHDMAAELALLRSTNAEYIYGEHFAESSGTYFRDLVADARAVGLDYLAESEITSVQFQIDTLPPSIREVIAKVTDPVRAEQYLDFVVDRRFRATLFCRAERKPRRAMDLGVVTDAMVSATCVIENDAFDLATTPITLAGAQGARVQVDQPALKVALGILVERGPEPLTIAAIVQAARTRIARSPRAAELEEAVARLPSELTATLVRLFKLGIVKLRGFTPKLTSSPGERPIARSLARIQAKDDVIATSVWHETVGLPPLEKTLVPLLDGTRDRDSLASVAKASRGDVDAAITRLTRAGLIIG